MRKLKEFRQGLGLRTQLGIRTLVNFRIAAQLESYNLRRDSS